MPVIKQMKMRRGRPERFIITLEEGEELVMSPEIVLKFGLSPGNSFSDDEFLKILRDDSIRQAKDQALRYLTVRPHSRRELWRKLREKGHRREVIDQVLDQLENVDLVNDEQFTRLFIQNELRLRPAGKMLLIQKLVQRGIPREMYEPLLNELLSEAEEMEIARSLAKKFVKSHSRAKGDKLKEKLVRYLQGKGFHWEQIKQVVPAKNEE
jgi:regulatory protein